MSSPPNDWKRRQIDRMPDRRSKNEDEPVRTCKWLRGLLGDSGSGNPRHALVECKSSTNRVLQVLLAGVVRTRAGSRATNAIAAMLYAVGGSWRGQEEKRGKKKASCDQGSVADIAMVILTFSLGEAQ